MYNTRIAPSPTGDMHIGTVRTAYFNWLAARASGGKFTLRIDDTDRVRSRDHHAVAIVSDLAWLGLDYDCCFKQSDSLPLYNIFADSLIGRGLARRDGRAIVLSLPSTTDLPRSWNDRIAGDIAITADDISRMDGMVLMKSDGMPAYNFASVADDIHGQINLIIRGVDHTTNTSRQVVLWHLLGANLPQFAHVGLICQKGRPLSKRDGAAGVGRYRDQGYDPDAMLNFLARLGWGPTKDDKGTAILTRDDMLRLFLDAGNMRNQAANLDLAKLDSFDRKYKARKKKAVLIA